MELRYRVRHVAGRPMAWAATASVVFVVGLFAWQVVPGVRSVPPANAPTSATAKPAPLLDREAERQAGVSRVGGPGGQVGDEP